MQPLLREGESNEHSYERLPLVPRWKKPLVHATVFALFFALCLTLAAWSGVFASELSGETDEAAHYVTALLVKDYVASGFKVAPMTFASDFYLHYPKVGLGHWPPLFYVTQASWMFLFGDSPVAVLVLMILMSTALAYLLYRVIENEFSTLAGVAAGLIFLCIPVVQAFGRMIMADMPVALCSFIAMMAWADYLNTRRRRSIYTFAFSAAAAILTKGNGYALVFLPPLSIILSKRWPVLRDRNLWMGGGLVALLTVPWNLFTRDLIVPTMQHDFGLGFILDGGLFYLRELVSDPGWAITFFAIIGIAVRSLIPFTSPTGVPPLWSSALAMLVGCQVFHSLVPAGLEPRYLIGSFAIYLMFAVAGIDWLSSKAGRLVRPVYAAPVLGAVAALVFFAERFDIPKKRAMGFDQVAQSILSDPTLVHARLLCSSSADGEGLLISEIARREKRPGHIVTRGTQLLAHMGWNGQDYQTLVHSRQDADRRLAAIPADIVVLDRTPGLEWLHQRLLIQALEADPNWKLQSVFPQQRKPTTPKNMRIEVYRWFGPERRDAPGVRVELKPSPKVVLVSESPESTLPSRH